MLEGLKNLHFLSSNPLWLHFLLCKDALSTVIMQETDDDQAKMEGLREKKRPG